MREADNGCVRANLFSSVFQVRAGSRTELPAREVTGP